MTAGWRHRLTVEQENKIAFVIERITQGAELWRLAITCIIADSIPHEEAEFGGRQITVAVSVSGPFAIKRFKKQTPEQTVIGHLLIGRARGQELPDRIQHGAADRWWWQCTGRPENRTGKTAVENRKAVPGPGQSRKITNIAQMQSRSAKPCIIVGGRAVRRDDEALAIKRMAMTGKPDKQPGVRTGTPFDKETPENLPQLVRSRVFKIIDAEATLSQTFSNSTGIGNRVVKSWPAV
jgi:hypothetical protein